MDTPVPGLSEIGPVQNRTMETFAITTLTMESIQHCLPRILRKTSEQARTWPAQTPSCSFSPENSYLVMRGERKGLPVQVRQSALHHGRVSMLYDGYHSAIVDDPRPADQSTPYRTEYLDTKSPRAVGQLTGPPLFVTALRCSRRNTRFFRHPWKMPPGPFGGRRQQTLPT